MGDREAISGKGGRKWYFVVSQKSQEENVFDKENQPYKRSLRGIEPQFCDFCGGSINK